MLSIRSTVLLFWSLGSASLTQSLSQCSYSALHGGGRGGRRGAVHASQPQERELEDVICNISKVHISISTSLSTLVNALQTLLQSAPSECLPRITHVSENGFSLAICIQQLPVPLRGLRAWHLPALPDLCPLLCSAAEMGEPDSMTFPGGESTLVWSLLKRIPHCVAYKPRWLLFGSIEHQPAWQQQQRKLAFYEFHSWNFVYCKIFETGVGETNFIETYSRGVMITDTEASPSPSPTNA